MRTSRWRTLHTPRRRPRGTAGTVRRAGRRQRVGRSPPRASGGPPCSGATPALDSRGGLDRRAGSTGTPAPRPSDLGYAARPAARRRGRLPGVAGGQPGPAAVGARGPAVAPRGAGRARPGGRHRWPAPDGRQSATSTVTSSVASSPPLTATRPDVLLAGLDHGRVEVGLDPDLVLLAGPDGDVVGVDRQLQRHHGAGRVAQLARLKLDPACARVSVDDRDRGLGDLPDGRLQVARGTAAPAPSPRRAASVGAADVRRPAVPDAARVPRTGGGGVADDPRRAARAERQQLARVVEAQGARLAPVARRPRG